ncbi:MAG: PKD domain-containing protein, partial [Flavobacteriales bacterium]|nr:PKD domain-containing protein [Flavobacteriales bacterium]
FGYTIDFGDGSPVVTGDTLLPTSFETHLYTAAVANYPVTITASCGVITGTVIMEVTPSASIQIPVGSPTFGCAPSTYAFENASTNVSGNTIFTWDWGDGSPLEVYGDTNWGDTLYHMYLPGTVACDVTVTLTADNNCPPISSNTYFPIQVWEIDDANITANATLLCYPDTVVHFDNTTIKNCLANGNTSQRYEYWNFGDYWGLGYDSIIPWQPWNPPARPGYDIAYPGIGTYTIMMIDSSFCGLDTAYATINIVNQPVAALAPNPDTICVGQNITFSNLSVGANSYSWNFGDGSGWIGTGGGSQTNTYLAAGTFTVFLVASLAGGSASCIDSASAVVEVLPSPQAIFSPNLGSACDSLDVTFTDASISAVTWYWDFGNGDTSTASSPPIISYTSPGVYTVELLVTSLNGCQDSITSTITIYETPVVGFTAPNVCVNQVTGFSDASTAGAQPITSWSWDFGDGNSDTVQNPLNTYTSAGPKNVVLTVSTGFCSATDSSVILADTLPTAAFTVDTADGCSPLTVTFTNTSSGAVTYLWDFADGNTFNGFDTSNTFIYVRTADTVYNVRLISTTVSGCVDTVYLPITVHPVPLVTFTSNAAPGCSPLQVSFTDASVGVAQYLWDFGDGSVDTINANPNHTFTNTTVFILVDTVQLVGISSFGCSDSSSTLVTIYPSANSVIAVPDTGCSPMTVVYSSTLTGAVLFNWDFGDGFTDSVQNPTHTYINPSSNDTTYTVTLIVTSGFFCVDTSYTDVLVYAKPIAQFSVDTPQGCSPVVVNFTNSSTGAASFEWSFGDGDTSDTAIASFPHTYTNSTGSTEMLMATLIVTSVNGCLDTALQPIQIFSSVFASFAQTGVSGCSPLSIGFSNTSLYSNLNAWDFGDGSPVDSSSDPVHVFTNTGTTDTTYTIRLIVLSNEGCIDTVYSQVTIYPSPVANFAVTPISQLFPNTTVSLVNLSGAGSWNYAWDFGDGGVDSTINPGSYSYGTWSSYTISLIVYSNECSDTAENIVTVVQPPPEAGFMLGDTAGCRSLTITLNDTSLYADSLMWDFGDGTPFYFASDTASISHTYYNAGIYTVSLTAFGLGGPPDTKQGIVEIYELPIASFAINPNPAIIYLPDKPIYCVNLSSNAMIYSWSFGDGNTSAAKSPSHIYKEVGDYDVTLIAESAFGCLDTLVGEAAVTVEEGGEILFPTAFTPDPSGPSNGIYDPNSFENNIFHPYWDGVDKYLLRIFNRWGELIFETEDIDQGWDGYYRDEMVQQDVYAWKATVLFENGQQRTMAGDVTLLR